MSIPGQNIIFFDGVCNLCNRSVRFLIRHDKKKRFRYAPIQSDIFLAFASDWTEMPSGSRSIVYYENGGIYTKSTAVLRILRHLEGIYSLFFIFIIIPKPLRDWVYDYIARNRYRWFGKRDSCLVPDVNLNDRFL